MGVLDNQQVETVGKVIALAERIAGKPLLKLVTDLLPSAGITLTPDQLKQLDANHESYQKMIAESNAAAATGRVEEPTEGDTD